MQRTARLRRLSLPTALQRAFSVSRQCGFRLVQVVQEADGYCVVPPYTETVGEWMKNRKVVAEVRAT